MLRSNHRKHVLGRGAFSFTNLSNVPVGRRKKLNAVGSVLGSILKDNEAIKKRVQKAKREKEELLQISVKEYPTSLKASHKNKKNWNSQNFKERYEMLKIEKERLETKNNCFRRLLAIKNA